MSTVGAVKRTLTTSVFAIGIGLTLSVPASADPDTAEPAPLPASAPGIAHPGPPPELPVADPMAIEGDPAATACSQFAAALDHASSYYSDFADSLADPSM